MTGTRSGLYNVHGIKKVRDERGVLVTTTNSSISKPRESFVRSLEKMWTEIEQSDGESISVIRRPNSFHFKVLSRSLIHSIYFGCALSSFLLRFFQRQKGRAVA